MRSGHIPTGGEFTVYSELVVCTHFLVVTCMQSTQPKSLQEVLVTGKIGLGVAFSSILRVRGLGTRLLCSFVPPLYKVCNTSNI